MITCKRCNGRVFVDRVYSQHLRVEMFCIMCGKRWMIKKDISRFAQWVAKQEETLSQAAISLAMGSGYCDILYRKGKPYGIKTTKEVKVKIVDHTVPDPTPTP